MHGYQTPREQQIQRALAGTDTTQGDVPDTVLDVLGDGGQPLDKPIQRALEERMDADFSNVRVHTGAKAAEAAESIDAKAFTCGNDIVFNSGEYDPESAEGQFLLAHELAHVRQQTGAAISMMPQSDADLEIDPDPQLEREADEAANDALSDEPLTINRMGTDVHVQRVAKSAESMTYEGLDTLTEAVADLRETVTENQREIQDTKSNLSALEDEVHSGWADKTAGAAAAVGASGITAGTRAATETDLGNAIAGNEMLMDLLPTLAQNGDVVAAAGLTAVLAGGTYGLQQAIDGAEILEKLGDGYKSLKDRLSIFNDDEKGQREEMEENQDESGGRFWNR
nr:DUF4157 domain-containing protein [Halopiger djelfimassiliensis]